MAAKMPAGMPSTMAKIMAKSDEFDASPGTAS